MAAEAKMAAFDAEMEFRLRSGGDATDAMRQAERLTYPQWVEERGIDQKAARTWARAAGRMTKNRRPEVQSIRLGRGGAAAQACAWTPHWQEDPEVSADRQPENRFRFVRANGFSPHGQPEPVFAKRFATLPWGCVDELQTRGRCRVGRIWGCGYLPSENGLENGWEKSIFGASGTTCFIDTLVLMAIRVRAARGPL